MTIGPDFITAECKRHRWSTNVLGMTCGHCEAEDLRKLLEEAFDHVKACCGCLEHGGTPETDIDKRILKAIGRGK